MFWVNCSILSCQFYFREYNLKNPQHRLNFRGNCSCDTTLGLCPQRILKENENGANTVKVFCIHLLLWTVFFPHGSHSFYIIQAENDLAVLYCDYYIQLSSLGVELHDSTHAPIHKSSVMAPHGSLATNYTNVHSLISNPCIFECNFDPYILCI